jgi:hypothetical protein
MANVATWADQFRGGAGNGWSAQLHYVDPLDGPPPESCVIHEMDCPSGGCVMSALANYVSMQIYCLTLIADIPSFQTSRVQDTTLTAANKAEALRFIIHVSFSLSLKLNSNLLVHMTVYG